ncbi:MAG TPA: STAS domain-containing protein [Candidatus Dormibacteraeota bacterium]|nr:STAS domain-containing protein [Candidatus Dormibacteraeota bacterium]
MKVDVPMTRIGGTLLVTLRGELDDTAVTVIEDQVTREVARAATEGTLIDVSGLDVIDSFIARVISRMVGMVRLLGSNAAVVGIQPAVALTLVEFGVPMGHLHTALNVEQGMALLRRLHRDGARCG